jgi:hypothetical protein
MDDEHELPEWKSLGDQVEEWRLDAIELYRLGQQASAELDQILAGMRRLCDAADRLTKTIHERGELE